MKILFAISLFLLTLNSGIINTNHNLSTTGSGSIKASSEQEICIFCHTPHHTRPQGTPLWNRSMPASAYTMYDSEYLRRFNYPMPTALGSDNGTPGAISRQCLSCHDGTVAVGSVYIVRGTILGETLIDMVGLTAGMMTSANTGYIGTDLSVHHPVGIQYSTTPTVSFGVGTRNMELKATPDSPIKLYDYSGTKYVECSSCHDPHKENAKFLHVDSGANHAQNAVTTCTACHSKDNWTGSIHQTATATYSDAAVTTKYGTNIVSDLGCINCHTPHNGEGKPYLLRQTQA
ncbi:MAG: hypothetical protein QG617_258, partial [Campylobacterota bacterium]|nr:hypothetical protein [Campylobacterota bacterium]